MKKYFLFLFLITFLFSLVVLGNVLAKRPTYSNHCFYTNITSVFQSHGMPQNSLIRNIEEIGSELLSLFVYDRVSNKSEVYLYSLGNDSILNTTDDYSFLLNVFSNTTSTYISPVMGHFNGSNSHTLYWISYLPQNIKLIQSCVVSSYGCTNLKNISSFASTNLKAILPSYEQDKIFMAFSNKLTFSTGQMDISNFKSCSVQNGLNDSCSGNISNFTDHPYSNSTGISYYYYKSAPSLGFLLKPNYQFAINYTVNDPDNQTYLFNMSSSNSGIISLPPMLDFDSATSFNEPYNLFSVTQDLVNLTNDSLSLIVPDPSLSINLDYFNVRMDKSYLIDYSSTSISTVYLYLGKIYKKEIGGYANPIYTYSLGGGNGIEIFPKTILPDGYVVGLRIHDNLVARFNCK